MRRRMFTAATVSVLLTAAALDGCGFRLSEYLDVRGGRAEVGAEVLLGGRSIGVLKPYVTAPGDTLSELIRNFMVVPAGLPEIVVVNQSGDTLRRHVVLGDYNHVEVSFSGRRLVAQASWDSPRADPNAGR